MGYSKIGCMYAGTAWLAWLLTCALAATQLEQSATRIGHAGKGLPPRARCKGLHPTFHSGSVLTLIWQQFIQRYSLSAAKG